MERVRKAERRRGIPQHAAFDVEKPDLLFNLPSNGIHMTHHELGRIVCRFLFSLFLFIICLRLHVPYMHTRRSCSPHVCAR